MFFSIAGNPRASGRMLFLASRAVYDRARPGNQSSGGGARMLAGIPDFRFCNVDESAARLYRWHEERRSAMDPVKRVRENL